MRTKRLTKLTATLLAFALLAIPAWPNSAVDVAPSLRGVIPAGYQVIRLQPSGTVISLLGLIECPEIKGARQVSKGLDSRIVLPDGNTMQRFPRHFSFRITASLRKTVIDPPSASLQYSHDPFDLLLGLKFKLRDYDALVSKELKPESVRMIGVPADIPYDERVFRVSFDIGERPVTDRFMLEIYTADGEQLGRFCFELL
ncbi:MAG TPA: hypothetical protein VJV96_09065 [Candidatus Angelobacter sp.]|nr:hypothetical protein [Candidatus Angelobacter sp.]